MTEWRVPMAQPAFLGREEELLREAMRLRSLSGRRFVEDFEIAIGLMAGTQHAIACSSGTAALHLALLALGVKAGDRIVVPACSYVATANAVRYCGAEPVFVDVLPQTWTIDWTQALAVLQKGEARGAIAVDLYGVSSLPSSGQDGWNSWFIVQDSCEAHGVPKSGLAEIAVYSFYGNKIVTCGEGGAVVTDHSQLDDAVRLYRGQGTTGRLRYVHEVVGFNYRLTDLQASVGLAQVERLGQHLARRAALSAEYDRLLPETVARQHKPRDRRCVDWCVPILVDERDHVAAHLASCGVETRPIFPALHQQPCYAEKTESWTWTGERLARPPGHVVLEHAERVARCGLLLPLHLGMDESDVAYVCRSLWAAERLCA